MAVPVQPISAICFHKLASKCSLPSKTFRTVLVVHFSDRNLCAWSLSIFWSSEKSKFIAAHVLVYPLEGTIEHANGSKRVRRLNADLLTAHVDPWASVAVYEQNQAFRSAKARAKPCAMGGKRTFEVGDIERHVFALAVLTSD